MAWTEKLIDNDTEWCSPDVSKRLLETEPAQIPLRWVQRALQRIQEMRMDIHRDYVGLDKVIDMLLAALIARENALLLGPPGVAKSELPVRIFQLLGLNPPSPSTVDAFESRMSYAQWTERVERERAQQKYFHYLLGRFTQPEELFGPVEIDHLRQGMLVRVNFGLLTGPGVRAAFLDEIFKASSNILNTLLTLTQERHYFNWGGMQPADLVMLIGASNEMPGRFASGAYGVASAQEDFQTLHAFIDRFPVRLLLESPSIADTVSTSGNPADSDLGRAFGKAFGREQHRFQTGHRFSKRPAGMPCINDVLCLGRAMLQGVDISKDGSVACDKDALFEESELKQLYERFFKCVQELIHAAGPWDEAEPPWDISPRKLRALFKLALAHALVRCKDPKPSKIPIASQDLSVIGTIWNSVRLESRGDLQEIVRHCCERA